MSTEAEAKLKVCWKTLAVAPVQRQGIAGTELQSVLLSAQCQGSKCMAWRWQEDIEGHGFCGLAGQYGALP